ncbi:MAG TPA: pyridoxamine 5'-phosphate oxidase family protein [Acetobacteraceae bacterium]|nr:pyridoxamine 5'-phosphate oxidase family protein [Acetobacteraceae bacterium]
MATGARAAGVLFVSTILLPIGKDIASRNTTKKGQAMESMEGYPPLLEVLSTEDEIEAAIGKPAPRMLAKVVDSLDDICRAFIARSPFVVVASSDSKGRCDVSPKGDLPGFVQILDNRTIAIPERPGNRRADTFRNVLQNRGSSDVLLIEIGTRLADDAAHYSDIDMKVLPGGKYVHLDDTPYATSGGVAVSQPQPDIACATNRNK